MALSSPRIARPTEPARSGRVVSLCVLSAATLLTACAPRLGPEPQMAPSSAFGADISFDAPRGDWPADDWWTQYQDPQLNQLMAEALRDSPDLKIAEARVRQAAASSERAGATRSIQANAKGSADEAEIGQSIGLPAAFDRDAPKGFTVLTQASANLSYALDFFGRNRAALASATSLEAATRADRAAARLELTVDVATAYANFLRLSEDRDTAEEAVRVRLDTLKLVGDRRRNGLETRGEYRQQDATVAAARATVDALDLQILQARHQIGALVGQGPDRGLDLQQPTQTPPPLAPYGAPIHLAADLVGRRPDLVAARARAEAARSRTKAARADFYPNVDLTAAAQTLSFNNENPFTHTLNLTQFGPAVSLPIFSGGQLEGAYRLARGEYDEAVAAYDQTLARALRDVADALAQKRLLAIQLRNARDALAADEDAYAIAKLRYSGGLSPYLSVLTVESALLEQRQAVVDLSLQSLTADLSLVRALGGGYNAADASRTSATR